MKIINKFFSSCSKLTRCFALALLAASLVSGLVSCKPSSDEDDNNEPEAYTAQPEHSRSCGAYALAYYLAKTDQIKYSEIETKAEDIYANGNVQFPEDTIATIPLFGSFNCGSYSNPEGLKAYIDSNHLATSATLKLISDTAATEIPETILVALADSSALNFNIPDENRIDSFEDGFTGCDYCIEIVTSGSSSLHYVLTYKKGDEFYTRDPDDGKEYKRSDLESEYGFSNSGIFIKK